MQNPEIQETEKTFFRENEQGDFQDNLFFFEKEIYKARIEGHLPTLVEKGCEFLEEIKDKSEKCFQKYINDFGLREEFIKKSSNLDISQQKQLEEHLRHMEELILFGINERNRCAVSREEQEPKA